MSTSPLALIAQLRFQLDQLGARNAHHEFEHLCRHFSREAITPNILPATGPVSAGGDQGRDFETFTTFIAGKPKDSTLFFGTGESKPLVFACTLQKKNRLAKKIEGDVIAICAAGAPHIIYYFSNQDLPVAKRHELQEWCVNKFACRLEVFDAQALSEQLVRPDLFWIAGAYLHVPAELLPAPNESGGSAYDKARERWIDGGAVPSNYAHFLEIKLGIRRATFNASLKSDLSRWIQTMEAFLADGVPADLQRRAVYEICVATLRGLHDLTPRKALVERYFEDWGAPLHEPAALQDATVLLSYCSTAASIGELEMEAQRLHDWSVGLIKAIDRSIAGAPGPNSLAEVLFVRAYASNFVYSKGIVPGFDLEDIFYWWFRLVGAAEKAPLFPVEGLADLLTNLTPLLGDDERFSKLTPRVDQLLENRSKGYVAAEKCRDRAVAFMKSGKPLEAIAEFHKAKIKWFTGDTIRGSVLAQLALSDAYLNLGLVHAAKYHVLSATFLIAKSSGDELRHLFPLALSQLGLCAYIGGEWVTYSEYFPIYLTAHYSYVDEPDDWGGNDTIQRTLAHFLIMRCIAKILGGDDAVIMVEAPLRTFNAPDHLLAELLGTKVPAGKYESMAIDEILQTSSQELWGRPFADSGQSREYRWRALGITWIVRCENTLSQVPAVEEFVAVLQIGIADAARSDLCLLPTTVWLEVAVMDVPEIDLVEVSDNTRLSYRVSIPQEIEPTPEATQQAQASVLAITTAILVWCSALPEKDIERRLDEAYQDGLPNKVMLARPYRELFLDFCAKADFDARRATRIGPEDGQSFSLRQSDELGWRDGPGPGYDKAKSLATVRRRYQGALLPLHRTLPELRGSTRFQEWIADRRVEGMLDWHILMMLANAVVNYRAPAIGGIDMQREVAALRELMSREERETDTPYPEAELYALDLNIARMTALAAVAQTSGLNVRSRTPDFHALKRLMDARYGYSTDDVPHEDVFAAPSD